MTGVGANLKMPGRKALDDICKVNLLEATNREGIVNIWNGHHQQYLMYWGRCISASAYNAMWPRLQTSPHFVVPVFRDTGLFNAVTNFDRELVGVSPLGEYQKQGDGTGVHMTVQFFTELARSKDLVLVRCEIKDTVFTRQDCLFVTQMLLRYYTEPRLYEEWVETFNKRPNQFDYHRYLRSMKENAEKGNKIDILDRKSTDGLRTDAFGPSLTIPNNLVNNLILNKQDQFTKDTTLGAATSALGSKPASK